jgi:hypothetical protein
MKFARVLSRRSASERHVVAFLRGDLASGPVAGLSDASEAFARVADIVRQRHIVVYTPASPFVSDGEIWLLTRLATAQRVDGRMAGDINETEYQSLLFCAVLLRDAGLWLPLHVPARDARSTQPGSLYGDRESGIVKARALSLARSRQVASTGEFAAIGVSRQYVSLLCKDGFLQRVRYGWYRAVPAEERTRSAIRQHL